MAAPMEHVLTGLRVLDFTRALAGPTCTRMFAEMVVGVTVCVFATVVTGD